MFHGIVSVKKAPVGDQRKVGSIYYKHLTPDDKVQISDDYMLSILELTRSVIMFHNEVDETKKKEGLNYWGVTILDPKMSKEVIDAIAPITSDSEDYTKIVSLLRRSLEEDKYLIHFGI